MDMPTPPTGGAQSPAHAPNATRYLLLFGNVGSSIWEAFRQSPEYHDHQPHPLNRWSARLGHALAEQFSAHALFPFAGPPHLPFLQWAKKAESLQNSKLGMLIHPRYGLWHAYRFALVFPSPESLRADRQPPPVAVADDVARGADAAAVECMGAGAPARAHNLCRRCKAKPCRGVCPVNAFSSKHREDGYDVVSCFHYLQANPHSKCMTEGCQARHACPPGAEYRYAPRHAAFHMRAFVAAMAAQKNLAKDMTEMEAESGVESASPVSPSSHSHA